MPPHVPDPFHTVTPALTARGAAKAIDFYQRVFGATELMRLVGPGGLVAHAELMIGDSLVMIAEEVRDWGNLSPQALNGSPVHLHLYVEDADAVAERAVAAGAEIVIPVADQFYGDRSGRLKDPFGHIWVVATRKEELAPDEVQRRFDEMMAQQGSG